MNSWVVVCVCMGECGSGRVPVSLCVWVGVCLCLFVWHCLSVCVCMCVYLSLFVCHCLWLFMYKCVFNSLSVCVSMCVCVYKCRRSHAGSDALPDYTDSCPKWRQVCEHLETISGMIFILITRARMALWVVMCDYLWMSVSMWECVGLCPCSCVSVSVLFWVRIVARSCVCSFLVQASVSTHIRWRRARFECYRRSFVDCSVKTFHGFVNFQWGLLSLFWILILMGFLGTLVIIWDFFPQKCTGFFREIY